MTTMTTPTDSTPVPTLGEQVRGAVAASAASRRFSDPEVEYIHATAQSLLRAGRMDKALSMLVVCVLYRPHNSKYLMSLGMCHRRLHNDHQALQAFAMATAMDPMNYDAALQVGECLLRLRRVDESRKVLGALVECAKQVEQAARPAARAKVLLELAGAA